jgi:hypothetical protein
MTRVSGKPIEIRVSQPTAGSDEPAFPPYNGPAFFSYGFRPFFLGAALFAGAAVPLWILILAGAMVPASSMLRASGMSTKCCLDSCQP